MKLFLSMVSANRSVFCLTGSAEGELSGGHAASDPQAGHPRSLHPGGGSGGPPAPGGAGCRRSGPRAAVRRPERHGQKHREGKLPQQRAHHQEVRGNRADQWGQTGKHRVRKIVQWIKVGLKSNSSLTFL